MTDRKANWQGMNWCRPSTRLAIYLRDGLACVWCGIAVESGVTFSLDHLKPHCKGGSNATSNLVTSCSRCNTSRGARTVAAFADAVADYLNQERTAEEIVKHIRNCQRRALPQYRKEARNLLERRGTVKAALGAAQ